MPTAFLALNSFVSIELLFELILKPLGQNGQKGDAGYAISISDKEMQRLSLRLDGKNVLWIPITR